MALKQFIVTQTVNYAGRGDKSSTHRISMDESEMAGYVALLDGQVRVFSEDLALSDTTSSTASSSVDTVSRIFIKHDILKTQWIEPSNKRPIVLKGQISTLEEYLKTIKPFPAPYSADFPSAVTLTSGNEGLL